MNSIRILFAFGLIAFILGIYFKFIVPGLIPDHIGFSIFILGSIIPLVVASFYVVQTPHLLMRLFATSFLLEWGGVLSFIFGLWKIEEAFKWGGVILLGIIALLGIRKRIKMSFSISLFLLVFSLLSIFHYISETFVLGIPKVYSLISETLFLILVLSVCLIKLSPWDQKENPNWINGPYLIIFSTVLFKLVKDYLIYF